MSLVLIVGRSLLAVSGARRGPGHMPIWASKSSLAVSTPQLGHLSASQKVFVPRRRTSRSDPATTIGSPSGVLPAMLTNDRSTRSASQRTRQCPRAIKSGSRHLLPRFLAYAARQPTRCVSASDHAAPCRPRSHPCEVRRPRPGAMPPQARQSDDPTRQVIGMDAISALLTASHLLR